jgi:hypothetical protein
MSEIDKDDDMTMTCKAMEEVGNKYLKFLSVFLDFWILFLIPYSYHNT